ncbi:MAG: sulfatase-like hydrolase/transferase [Actinomycetaceae bacterium]|nr:sulfatase-like hydrolase/transferase [Actinomycetaceae bacterium]
MTEQRPNIVFVLTDDQGPWAVPWKMPELQMPNLSQMAQRGTVFNNFYCTSPVCSPARASLLTGRMPSAHGVNDWLVGTRHPQARPDIYLDDVTLLPAVLAGAGYRCALTGKWHVGESREPAPGFVSWYAHQYGGGPYYDAPIWDEEGNPTTEPEYFTNAVAARAVDFIRDYDSEDPFFLFVATTAPHDPWDASNHPDELLDLYADCDFPSVPREEPHPWVEPRAEHFAHAFADPEPSLRGYCASLTGVDRLMGQIQQALSQRDFTENTVVIYMADNGFSCGHHGIWGKGNGTWPLNFFENSVRVPMVIDIPASLRERFEFPAQVDDHVSAASFFPTICDLAGVQPPVDPLRAGVSLLQDGKYRGCADPVGVFDEYGGGRMVRSGQWKLVERFDGPTELYDLDADPEEKRNLAGQAAYEDVQQRLSQVLRSWFGAHETAQHSGWELPVSGLGQIHPNWRSRGDEAFVQGGSCNDGNH